MLTELLFTVFLQVVGRSKTCEFNRQDILSYQLSYLKGETTIEVNSPDARLVSCKPWKEFPYLLVVEIDMGVTENKPDLHETELFIFDTLSKDLREVFKKKVRTSRFKSTAEKKLEELVTWDSPYQLVKTNSGKPGIRWTKSSELVTLD